MRQDGITKNIRDKYNIGSPTIQLAGEVELAADADTLTLTLDTPIHFYDVYMIDIHVESSGSFGNDIVPTLSINGYGEIYFGNIRMYDSAGVLNVGSMSPGNTLLNADTIGYDMNLKPQSTPTLKPMFVAYMVEESTLIFYVKGDFLDDGKISSITLGHDGSTANQLNESCHIKLYKVV